jgi:hypothetical protein
MAESHLISALKQRRIEYLDEFEAVDKTIDMAKATQAEILVSLGYVDGLLHKEVPGIVLEDIRPRKKRSAHPRAGGNGRGGVAGRPSISKATLRLLRTGKRAMTVDQLADGLASQFTSIDRTRLKQNIRTTLSNGKRDGTLRAAANDVGYMAYEIAA